MVRGPEFSEPRRKAEIEATDRVDFMLTQLGRADHIAIQHMQPLPRVGRVTRALVYMGGYGRIDHEVVPMIRIMEAVGWKKPIKLMELYGPAFVKGSLPVASVTGIEDREEERGKLTGCTLFVPFETLPPEVRMTLSLVEPYPDAVSYRINAEGNLDRIRDTDI